MQQTSFYSYPESKGVFMPPAIIVSCDEPARDMWRAVRALAASKLNLLDEDAVIRFVLQALQHRDTVGTMLGHNLLEIISDTLGFLDETQRQPVRQSFSDGYSGIGVRTEQIWVDGAEHPIATPFMEYRAHPQRLTDVIEIHRAISDFADTLYQQLVALGAYYQGYLHYQFDRWILNDIVLTKLQIPYLR